MGDMILLILLPHQPNARPSDPLIPLFPGRAPGPPHNPQQTLAFLPYALQDKGPIHNSVKGFLGRLRTLLTVSRVRPLWGSPRASLVFNHLRALRHMLPLSRPCGGSNSSRLVPSPLHTLLFSSFLVSAPPSNQQGTLPTPPWSPSRVVRSPPPPPNHVLLLSPFTFTPPILVPVRAPPFPSL